MDKGFKAFKRISHQKRHGSRAVKVFIKRNGDLPLELLRETVDERFKDQERQAMKKPWEKYLKVTYSQYETTDAVLKPGFDIVEGINAGKALARVTQKAVRLAIGGDTWNIPVPRV